MIRLAQDKVANEHYVPKAYLRSFMNDAKKCHVYDKTSKKYFPTGINNILAERYMYDFPKEMLMGFSNVDPQAVEKFLANTMDGYWGNIVNNINQNFQWFSLKYSYHFLDVYRCITMQLLRTPNGKKMLADIYGEVYQKEIKSDFENIFLARELIKIIDDNFNSVLLEILLEEFGHISIGVNDTCYPFVTSDNPVVTIPNIWNKDERMIFYPVTPNRCLFLLKRKKVESQLETVLNKVAIGKYRITEFNEINQEAYQREKAILKELNPESIVISEVDALVLNSCIYLNANKYIVSNVDIEKCHLWTECHE